MSTTTSRRVWLALLAPPFLLGATFAPVVVYLSQVKSLEGEALMRAAEPLAPLPATVAFLLVLMLTVRLAKKDGLSWPELGWRRPRGADLLAGCAVAALLVAVNHVVVFPLLHTVRPQFDPTVPSLSFLAAAVTLTVAVVGEDTLFRGYAFRVLEERRGRLAAVVVTTSFYAVLAPGQGWPLHLYAFYLGLALCAVRLWRGNLLAVAIPHLAVGLAPKIIAAL